MMKNEHTIYSILSIKGVCMSFPDIVSSVEDNLDKLTINRILQEPPTNILKHSTAPHACILLAKTAKKFYWEVKNNAIVFESSIKRNCSGINNVYSREAMYKGALVLVSVFGK